MLRYFLPLKCSDPKKDFMLGCFCCWYLIGNKVFKFWHSWRWLPVARGHIERPSCWRQVAVAERSWDVGLAKKWSCQGVLTLNYLLSHPTPNEASAVLLSPSDLWSAVLFLSKTTKALFHGLSAKFPKVWAASPCDTQRWFHEEFRHY